MATKKKPALLLALLAFSWCLMATKKPAKPIAGQARSAPSLDPAIYGTQVRYLGLAGKHSTCETCGKVTKSGMLRMKEDKFYCTVKCAGVSSKQTD